MINLNKRLFKNKTNLIILKILQMLLAQKKNWQCGAENLMIKNQKLRRKSRKCSF